MTDDSLHDCANPRNRSAHKSDSDIPVLVARGQLKNARHWLGHPQRRVRPKSRRGRSILGWVADHARLAYPTDPESAVRRCCRQFAPKLTEVEIDELVVASELSNKTWTPDQCALVLGISFEDQTASGFQFVGCDDDLNYDRRRERREGKNAAAARKYRAGKGASTRRGRPRLHFSEEDKAVRRAEDAARKRAKRAAKSSGRPRGRPRSEGIPVRSLRCEASVAVWAHSRKESAASQRSSTLSARRSSARVRPRLTAAIGMPRCAAIWANRKPE